VIAITHVHLEHCNTTGTVAQTYPRAAWGGQLNPNLLESKLEKIAHPDPVLRLNCYMPSIEVPLAPAEEQIHQKQKEEGEINRTAGECRRGRKIPDFIANDRPEQNSPPESKQVRVPHQHRNQCEIRMDGSPVLAKPVTVEGNGGGAQGWRAAVRREPDRRRGEDDGRQRLPSLGLGVFGPGLCFGPSARVRRICLRMAQIPRVQLYAFSIKDAFFFLNFSK
jgi:hypothetical protein